MGFKLARTHFLKNKGSVSQVDLVSWGPWMWWGHVTWTCSNDHPHALNLFAAPIEITVPSNPLPSNQQQYCTGDCAAGVTDCNSKAGFSRVDLQVVKPHTGLWSTSLGIPGITIVPAVHPLLIAPQQLGHLRAVHGSFQLAHYLLKLHAGDGLEEAPPQFLWSAELPGTGFSSSGQRGRPRSNLVPSAGTTPSNCLCSTLGQVALTASAPLADMQQSPVTEHATWLRRRNGTNHLC